MAPWPEQGSEPKVIDKEDKQDTSEITPKQEVKDSADIAICGLAAQAQKVFEDKEVLTLDEGQLKALLDEAITYKNPKDREGKSELFKELLQKVEADEGEKKGLGSSLTSKLPKNYCNLPVRKKSSRQQGRECGVGVSSTRGGSLQNLNALGMESSRAGRAKKSGRGGDTLVSARQREGGSLPTNVNVDNDPDLESIYTSRATLEVLGSRNEDNKNIEEPNVSTAVQPSLPNGSDVPFNFSTFCPGSKEEVENKKDDPVPPTCITVAPLPLDFDAVFTRTSAIQQHISRLSLAPSQINTASSDLTSGWAALINKDPDSKTKSLDENGNALNNVRAEENYLDRKKQRKSMKMKNDRNSRAFKAEEVEGFRGGDNIETLMEYIESPSNILEGSKSKVRPNQINGPRNHVKVRAKEEDSRPIKRRTKEKLKRYNSLEEISKTKLEDLTEEGSNERVNGPSLTIKKKQVTLDDAQLGKKSSWTDESFLDDSSMIQRNNKPGKGSQEGIQDSEFHLVTKKHRKTKRRSGSGRVRSRPPVFSRDFPAHDRTLERSDASGLLYQYNRHGRGKKSGSQPRRKSASSVPPSDKSDSSDLDSVHSLPVSSSTPRTKVGKNSVSGDSTPQASYADMARITPPDIGSQVNVYSRGNVSHYLSCAEPDFEMMSTNRIPNVMLPASFASCSFKKDAMTDTTCDNIKPAPLYEEYPPLGIKSTELFIEKTFKGSNSARDNIPEGKMSLKTVPHYKNVIPVNKCEDVPLVVPSPCVKSSSVSNPNCKRPPVILMDEPKVNSEIPVELTFGFEVNQQLLQCEVPMCNISNDKVTAIEASTTPTSSSQPTSVRDESLIRLINYHNSAWDTITKDLRTGRAMYYNGQ